MTGEEPGEGLFADAREEDDKINPLRLWPAHNVLDVSIVCRDIDTGTARTAGCPFVSRGGGMWRDFCFKSVDSRRRLSSFSECVVSFRLNCDRGCRLYRLKRRCNNTIRRDI